MDDIVEAIILHFTPISRSLFFSMIDEP